MIVPLGYQLLFILPDIKDMENISTRGVKVCSGEHDGSPGSCRRQERWPPPGGAGVVPLETGLFVLFSKK
jgi:hypothetical protein